MATAKQRLEYEVRLKDLASQALRNMGDNAKKETTRAQKAFKKLSKVMGMVKVAIVAAFAAGVFMGLRNGIQRAREFSKAMGEVNTILGTGGMQIGAATKEVEKLALALGVPAPEIAAGFYQTLSAGVTDSKEAMILLEGATKLGIAGVATTKESVDLLTTSFNAYGKTVTEEGVAAMSDLIFKTVQLGKTTIPELSASMGQVLPVAAQMNVSFEEVAAAVASLTLKGLSTAEAVTQVNAVFTAFLKKGDLAKKTFGATSKIMGATTLKTKGFRSAIQDLMKAVDGNEDALIKMMGRAEGAKAVMALTAEGGRVLAEQFEGISTAAGSAEEAFTKMSDTLDRKMSVMEEGIVQGFAEIGEAMMEAMLGADTSLEEMSESAEGVKTAIAGLSPLVNILGLLVSAMLVPFVLLGTAIQGIAKDFMQLGNVLGIVSDESFSKFNIAFKESQMALVAAAEAGQNFGRALIGIESNGMKATAALRAQIDILKNELSPAQKEFNRDLAMTEASFAMMAREVKAGSMTEVEALVFVKQALQQFEVQADAATRAMLGLSEEGMMKGGGKAIATWRRMVAEGTLFLQTIEGVEVTLGGTTDKAAKALAESLASWIRIPLVALIKPQLDMKGAIEGMQGTDLAKGMGGSLASISGFFELSPTFNLENLRENLAEAKDQISAALEGGIIDEKQSQDMLDMIANVELFKLKELEAAAATYEFRRSLEGLGEVEAGVSLGFKQFTDEMPELGDQIAEITNEGLKMFATGLTDAFMAFADGSKSASEAFRDFGRTFIAQLGAMIVQMLIMRALAAAIPGFGAFMGMTGYADGGVVEGGVKTLATGGVVSGGLGRAIPVRGYAAGGPIVSSPHLALIGEGSQNEAVVPLPDGRSIPVDMMGGGGANVSFTINAVDARGIDELLVERQATIRNLIRQAVTEDRVFRQSIQGA